MASMTVWLTWLSSTSSTLRPGAQMAPGSSNGLWLSVILLAVLQRDFESEHRALGLFAHGVQRAAHSLRQRVHGQAQPGAAITSGNRAVGLEGGEHGVQFFAVDPDTAVTYGAGKPDQFVIQLLPGAVR